ncbi:MAG: hypothetical protein Q9220_002844 [cf. Caloplaca sp. 1 TL-2023]
MAKSNRAVTISSMPKMSESSSSSSARSNGPFSQNEVRVVTKKQSKAAADCLAHAFAEDDVAMYFVKLEDTVHWSERQRWDLHVKIMRSIVMAHCMKGLTLTILSQLKLMAIRMPPGKNMDDRLTMFRSGMWLLNYKLSNEGKSRFNTEFLPLLHRTKEEVLGALDNNSWYLVYLGTKPAARGKGYARMVIEYVTKQVSDLRLD